MVEPVHLYEQQAKGDSHNEMSLTHAVKAPSGFTAVNGLDAHSSLVQPYVAEKSLLPGVDVDPTMSNGSTVAAGWQNQSQSWKAGHDDRNDRVDRLHSHTSAPAVKRKHFELNDEQSGEITKQRQPADGRDESPKRQALAYNAALAMTLGDRPVQSPVPREADLTPFGPNERQPTPPLRANRGEPPPVPSEIGYKAQTASLREFQQSQQTREQARPVAQLNQSPPNDTGDDHDDPGGSDDQLQGDNHDSGKRKRNFSNRVKTGCHTCRHRKKKCDEAKPKCQNCEKGGFECAGYGPKVPSELRSHPPSRITHAVQAKPQQTTSNPTDNMIAVRASDASLWKVNESEPLQQYIAIAPTEQRFDQRRPETRDGWSKTTWAAGHQLPLQNEQPVQMQQSFQHMPLQQPFHHQYEHQQAQIHRPPNPGRQYANHFQNVPPPLPIEPVYAYHNGPGMPPNPFQSGPPFVMSSRDSVTTSSSHRTALPVSLGYTGPDPDEEKHKMIRGQPCQYYLDSVLVRDRQMCRIAVEKYNRAFQFDSGKSDSDRAKLFTQILRPIKRTDDRQKSHIGPEGTIDDHTIIQPPFNCEYGYNINIGKETMIETNCFLQDAANISIGDRVMIGPNTKFYCITASLDPKKRRGSQGTVTSGAIKVGDDCQIGADVTILPFVAIGDGAVVGAGSVVTRNVDKNTIVAGNPAKFIRSVEAGMAAHHKGDLTKQQKEMKSWMEKEYNRGRQYWNKASHMQ